MSELSKSENQVLYCFYDINQPVTKQELLEKVPSLNKNTTAAVIRSLLDKGYLKVGEIRYSRTVLARAYKPCVPFVDFLKDEYGADAVEKLVKHAIGSLYDVQQINYLSDLVTKRTISLGTNE
ncbi:transcriptional regulator, BlaI/MecI/CopY family protein [Enterococcus innesii]|uniref:transcriptional regulator, BlaI/MecI/CopY family protein n=1 Tax=Enterococcus innesii TaxID=2839759 RepID=UPI002DB99EE8|nr:transcriptional regulator, BlaI/MecI/CopY family protein [Enterococcus innesii]MEB5953158.1 transcriptional regulator, BlaI/MecI/CopY family protein [Enterococcus innesii]